MLAHLAPISPERTVASMADETIDLEEVQRNLDRRRLELEASEGVLRRDSSPAIGALASRMTSTPEALASTLERCSKTSPPGQQTPPAGRAISVISRRSSVPALDARQTVVRLKEALASRDSDKAGLALQALLRPLERSSLEPELTSDFEVTGYRLTGPIPAQKLAVLTAWTERMTEPCGREAISREALRCLSLTKSRERDAADLQLFAAALADELAEFPIDVATTAFRKWARREKWWPSLAEIREPCLREMRWRRSLKIALEDASRMSGGTAA